MKKLLFASLLALLSISAIAQQKKILYSDVAGKTAAQSLGDTVTNTATKTQSSKIIQDSYTAVAVEVKLSKISGTVAGVVRLYASIDGTNYVRIAPTDSLNAANVTTNYKIFNVLTNGSKWPYSYVRIGYTGVGTMAAGMVSNVLVKK